MNERRDFTSIHPDAWPTLVDLKAGAHLCSLYETEAEHRALLTPFLRHGLNRGEKVLYIVDARTAETILRYLEDDGLAVQPYLQQGQLRILTVSDAYMRDGLFEPERMIALLQAETDQAVAEGYPVLRVTGEMTWALRGLPGSERLIEYESKLNTFLPGSRCLALCQYDRRRFPPEVQLDILATHPMVVVGTALHDNPYYLPPAAFLVKNRPEARLEQWLNNLAARKQMETNLRQVVHDRGERAKELTCLYQSTRLLQDHTTPITDILQELVALLPPAWQYPEITAARITLNGNQYATPNFTETQWKQSAAFKTADGQQGEVEVVYLEARPDEVEGPFLAEERALINAVAEILVSYQGRKQTEEAFRASEETFRAMSTSAQDAIILLDAEGKITFWNQAAERIFGYPAREVLGREIHRFCVPARFREDSLKGMNEFRLTGKGPVIGKTLELAALRRDGVEFPVELSVSAVKLGGQWNAVGILRDITERKQAEKQAGLLVALVESSDDAIISKTLDGTVMSWNHGAEQLYGYTAQEMVGRSINVLLPPDKKEEVQKILEQILRGERVRLQDTVRVRKDGTRIDVSVTVSPILNRVGRIVGASTIARDVTERKRQEADFRRLASFPQLNPSPIVEVDAAGTVTYANPMALKWYRDLAAIGVAHPFLQGTVDLLARLKRESGETEVREVTVGEHVYTQVCTPIEDYTRLRIYSLDITDRKRSEDAVRVAAQYTRSLLEASLDPLLTISPDGKITDVNEATVLVTGAARTRLIGSDFSTYFTEPDRAKFGYQTVMREGFVRDYPLTIRHPSGRKTNVLYNATLYRNERGEVQGIFAAARDITERTNAERALREQTRLLELFFTYTQTSIVFLDRNFNFIRVNEAYAKACSKAVSDFPGHNHFELYPSDMQQIFEQVRETKTPFQVLARPFVFPDHPEWGITYWDWTLVPIVNASGEVDLFVFSLNNVTDRKRAEAQTHLLTRALESAANGIVITNAEGEILWANPAFSTMTGYNAAEVIGQNPRLLKSGWQDQTFYRRLWNTIKAGNVWHEELVNKRKDGTVYTEEMTIAPVPDDQGVISNFVAIKQDITERKQMERYAQRIEQLASMGQLLGGIVHELKNPLFVVTGRLQLLKEKLANREYDKLDQDLQKIEDAAQRTGGIAQRFLTLARPIQPSLQVCSLPTILRGVLDFLSNELMKARIRVIADYAADLPSCLSDPAQLHQAFLNLAVNALQAMTQAHGQGVLKVSVQPSASGDRQEEQWIEVRIQDDGPGISSEHRARLFEPFFTTKPPGEGTGLGLWTVSTIVTSLNGTVTCESEVGQGAAFIIRLPVTKEVAH